ncbi:MAG: hypothetical protein GTO53_05950 [Planctomycetales bacterium]|nr:hypothetical protein [Planctomycetales bacterium]NIM08687.1 hypothetical protein [Planctomycetales bacterium]NIN08161.1 hypothetical protein [Planctomycetales bacterium]NIN77288.1 hypothetical protein [Planctomycetales bacterium]NIO34472.1 hypothetical protein [Planctomycetales bacterium]
MNVFVFRRVHLAAFAILLLAARHTEAQAVRLPDPGQNSALPVDVALQADQSMHGMLLDRNGSAVARTVVTLYRDQMAPQSTTTDAAGHFRFTDARGGLAVLASGQQLSVVRLWAPRTAPPHAHPQAVLYFSEVMRGQGCGPGAPCGGRGCPICSGGMGPIAHRYHGIKSPGGGIFGGLNLPSVHPVQALKNPATLGVLIGGAVALPIVLHEDERLPVPGS